MSRIDRAARQRMTRDATDARLEALRTGATVDETVETILRKVPAMTPLESWRIAKGWSRTELSARLDAVYQQQGLRGPGLSSAQLCRWEHGQQRPQPERIDALCEVYETRPDQLGFGTNFAEADIDHLQAAGITTIFSATNRESQTDLVDRVRDARRHITVIGLTRNFYASQNMLPLFEGKAIDVPVTFYVMSPWAPSRADRYRLEPAEASMEDPQRFIREVLRPLQDAADRINPLAHDGCGITVRTFNFPCPFAIEHIDDRMRVSFYGIGKRGTEAPIFVISPDNDLWRYFEDQLQLVTQLAEQPREPWITKGLSVDPLPTDLSQQNQSA